MLLKLSSRSRGVYNSISKFLPFQRIVDVVATVVAFIGACVAQDSPLKPLPHLWVYFRVDVLLPSYASEKPTESPFLLKPNGMGIFLVHFNYKINEFIVTLFLLVKSFLILVGKQTLSYTFLLLFVMQ